MSAQSLNIPRPRGALTPQQFSSGEPARHCQWMSCTNARRSPSIGVLYVVHRPVGEYSPNTLFRVDNSNSSATMGLLVSFSISTLNAIHAIVQHVSIGPATYELPI